MKSIDIIPPRTREEFEQYYRLRWQILRQPWGQPPGSERDGLESTACHAMAVMTGGEVVGVARLHRESESLGQIRYMAVSPDYQRKGIGSALLDYLEAQARQAGTIKLQLNARKSFQQFYRQHGYRDLGPGPILFGQIEHIRMEKDIAPAIGNDNGETTETKW